MGVFEELQWRGLVHQTSADDELPKLLADSKVTMYIGYDPTAGSLHAGSLIPLTLQQHFLNHGHEVICLIGGATGAIGDPGGKSAERNLLDLDTVRANTEAMTAQARHILQPHDGNEPRFVNNLEWLSDLHLLPFLRDIGKHFSINQMMNRDSVKRRFEGEGAGISYTEFSYMLLQSFDYLELNKRYNCTLQCGASDQWGNIVSGMDLVRRLTGSKAHALTAPLMTNAKGEKYGKSEKGAVFLDPALTSPYRFYQFWVNSNDSDVPAFLKWLTFLPRAEIEALESELGSGARKAQKTLAYEVTKRVHGRDEADRAVAASRALFGGDIRSIALPTLLEIFEDVPSVEVGKDRLAGAGLSIVDLLADAGACKSKGDARRQLQQGGIAINGDKLGKDGAERMVTVSDFIEGQVLILRRGKKANFLVRVA